MTINQVAIVKFPIGHDAKIGRVDPNTPVSTIAGHTGDAIVLSRYRDSQWDMSPYFKTANSGAGSTRIIWNTRNLPETLIFSCKAAVYAYWKYGVYGKKRPEARTVVSFGHKILILAEWLNGKGIHRFQDICGSVVDDYVAFVCNKERGLRPSSKDHYLATLETLFTLNDRLEDSIESHPWPDQSSTVIAGRKKHNEGVTAIIPQDVAQKLFQKAVQIIDRADVLFAARGKLIQLAKEKANLQQVYISRIQTDWLKNNGMPDYTPIDIFDLQELSTACYVVIAMLSGMRNHEIASIKTGGYYESEIDGELIGWVKGESHKTFEGNTEWMVQTIVGKAASIQERIAKPFRASFLREMEHLITAIEHKTNEVSLVKMSKRLTEIRANKDRIFLCRQAGGKISNLTDAGWRARLKSFSKEFDWHLTSHQFRRTFAVFVAHNAMGDLRYLRHHFKHWSMDMTLLYARNERQDQDLYEEMLQEINGRKISVVEHWLDESTPISGGNVERLTQYRKRPDVKTLKDRRALAETISDQVNIRGTGHSWCLSDGQGGCGGKGLYEMTRCGGCSDGVIDDTHKVVWLNLHQQQKELLELTDIGPGGHQRVVRDIERVEKVLTDLAIPLTLAVTVTEEMQ